MLTNRVSKQSANLEKDRSEYTSATGSYSCSSNLDRSDKQGKNRQYNIYPNVIMVLRCSERVDEFFPDWISKTDHGYKPYDLNMPMHLPIDRPPRDYKGDAPITNTGDVLARMIGRGMFSTAYVPDIIYSSPALRCLQTAYAVRAICKSNTLIRFVNNVRRYHLRGSDAVELEYCSKTYHTISKSCSVECVIRSTYDTFKALAP
ncbi:unnamed protein product [Heligmosomoides polygyrus]|uniref:Protein kinase domain-containing protein n=1 Tax=Heligmosomoides polygyrus TaxID=6339 RepID=A0A183FT33_HELPZ|nr:unnamed protein product [Heligmosomoides polygyrus]